MSQGGLNIYKHSVRNKLATKIYASFYFVVFFHNMWCQGMHLLIRCGALLFKELHTVYSAYEIKNIV